MPGPIIKALLFYPKTLVFWLVLAAFFLQGCENEVPIPPLPAAKQKLVVYALISPEVKGIKVSVTRTVPVSPYSGPLLPAVVNNATVRFSDGQDTITLSYDPLLETYTWPNFNVKPGNYYWLSITAPGDLSAKAHCFVPYKINQSLTVSIDSTSASPGTSGKSYVVQLDWQDLTGSGDFYKVNGAFTGRNNNFPGAASTYSINFIDSPIARDHMADGRKWQRRSEILPTDNIANYGERPDSVYAYLLTTDQPYYDFHSSLYKFRETNETVNGFTDPVSIYSNIEGGYGIFAAYRSYRVGVNF